jgi:hypothetical protein
MVDKVEGQPGQSDQPSKSATEGSGALRKNVTDLLNEWDQPASKGTDSGKDAKKAPGLSDDVTARLERLEALATRTSYESDMKSIVATVRGDLDVDDFVVEAWVNRKADSDPRLVQLWNERDSKKSQFQEVIKSLAPECQEFAKTRIIKAPPKTEEKETGKDAKESLSAAVRSAREASPSSGYEDLSWAGLNDNQFALKKAEVFRLQKAGKLA